MNERRLAGRIGAYVMHSRHDPRDTTSAAREAFLSRFENEVDPERRLAEEERVRRAIAARKAYFARLALRSAQSRSSKAKDVGSRKPPTSKEIGHGPDLPQPD